jgi:periplasmic protein TonB
MTPKKSNAAKLEDKKTIFLLIGFVVVLSTLYIALEWSKSYEPFKMTKIYVEPIDIIDIPITKPELPPPPPPPKIETIEEINIVDNKIQTESVEFSSETGKDVLEVPIPLALNVENPDDFKIVDYAERMPSFPGGDKALFEFLSNNIKYPIIPQENMIQGRVICQFVVNKDGTIVEATILRSIDPHLDKEALRVIKLMPKWSPGWQDGKTVRVKYTLPVNFKLQM